MARKKKKRLKQSEKITLYQKRAEKALERVFSKNSNIANPARAARYEAADRAKIMKKYGYEKGKKIISQMNSYKYRHKDSKLHAGDILNAQERYNLTLKESLKAAEKISSKEWYGKRLEYQAKEFVKTQIGRGWTVKKPKKLVEYFKSQFKNEAELSAFYEQYGNEGFNERVNDIYNYLVAEKIID